MGAWSHKPFGNDDALDWVGDLTDLPHAQWRANIAEVMDAFEAFEARRARGENKSIRTAEDAEALIALFAEPDEEYFQIIRSSVGSEDEDNGDSETLTLIAAGHVLLAALTDDRSALPEELLDAPFDALAPVAPLAQKAAALLALVPGNRPLCRDFGPTWKRGVTGLAERLHEAAERA